MALLFDKPLAELLRPESLETYTGQQHIIGAGKPLRNSLENGRIPSMILWGPPGVGKTSLARIMANHLDRPFYTLSAVSSGVKEVRKLIDEARMYGGNAILFIDEIHRFSKSQQDSLLAAVEEGTVVLIGATTENPSFEVISPLLSRAQVYILEHLSAEELVSLVDRALRFVHEKFDIQLDIKETEALLMVSGGDARKLYNAVELICAQYDAGKGALTVDNAYVQSLIQKKMAIYDKSGEQHYDIISAFIKSVRGSDPNAAVYWLARMIEGGEDPKFIARRLIILASEDIGLANPNALLMANAAFDAIERIGMPEGRIILSQATIYLAGSPKSNASYMAIGTAQKIVKKTGDLPVPLHLRNAHTKLMKNIGYGANYQYAHDFMNNFALQEYLPDALSGTQIYKPGANKREQSNADWLRYLWKDKYPFK